MMFLVFIRPIIFLIKLYYINKLNDYHPFLWNIRVRYFYKALSTNLLNLLFMGHASKFVEVCKWFLQGL